MTPHPTLEDEVSAVLIILQCSFAALAFTVYDWSINLDEEIHCFWSRRKLNAAVFLYGLTRYSTIVYQILVVQSAFLTSDTACQDNIYLQEIMNGLQTLSMSTFSAIRVYALSPGSKFIVICTFLLLIVPGFIMSVLNGMSRVTALPSPFNCNTSETPIAKAIGFRVALAGRVCNMAADLLVLFITWRKTYKSYRCQREVLHGPSLVRVMLYNGSTYFTIITLKNIFEAIVQGFSNFNGGIYGAVTAIFSSPVNMFLTCHFLLDLHRANDASIPSSPSALPSLNFAVPNSRQGNHETLPAFIASMGSLIHMPESPLEEDVAQNNTLDVAQNNTLAYHEDEGDEEPEIDRADAPAGQDESVIWNPTLSP